jgi:hypothetical protein
MKNTAHLAAGYPPEIERQISLTVPGMAHFAATGPLGTSCAQCALYGYWQQVRDEHGNTTKTKFRKGSCRKFFELTEKHGPKIPEQTASCRYFKPT